jgi:hypothetical protein
MDSVNDVIKNKNQGFINTVFNMDFDSKAEMLNMIQYIVIAIIPCVLILKSVRYAVPEEDHSKGSVELVVEIILQIVYMILAMYFSNKAIKYIPTYSGVNYVHEGDTTNFLLPFVILLLTMQTKIGAKVNIIFDRLIDAWHGRTNTDGSQNTEIKVLQPLSSQYNHASHDQLDNAQLLPTNQNVSLQIPSMPSEQSPDFNQMYQQQPTSKPQASTPGFSEPMAANELGGGFSNW